MTDLDAEGLTQTQRHEEAGHTTDQRQQVVLAPDSSHPFEELASVQDPDAVEEHDQAGQPDGAGDLRLRSKCAKRKTDEQNGAHTE